MLRCILLSIKDCTKRSFLMSRKSAYMYCRHVPKEIIKPKPDDLGICLCMPCPESQLRLGAIKRTLEENHLITESLKNEEFVEDTKKLQIEVEDCKLKIMTKPLNISNDQKRKGKMFTTGQFSKKNARSSSEREFSKEFIEDVETLVNRASRFKSHYQRIADIKHIIQDPSRKSKLLRWSENVDLYETHQEKSHYYSSISASIKAVA